MMYYLFILAIGVERLAELVVARRNAKWSIAHGGKEFGRDHYPAMVSMHALLLVSCIVEVWDLGRPFIPWLGWPMVAVVAVSTIVRWRCVTVLGKHWNPRLIVIPGAPLVQHGLYRWVRHPNYTAVAAEVAALPDDSFDLVVSLTPEAQHRAVEIARSHAVELAYWPIHDPTLVMGSREAVLEAYREARDALAARIRERFGKPVSFGG